MGSQGASRKDGKMNALDIKIDSMIKNHERYNELQSAVKQLLRVMNRASVISFLKYAESLNAGK
jgi:hypothetical protein